MANAMSRIGEYTEGIGYEDFMDNHLIQDGVIRQIEILGEAAKRIPVFVRDKHPEIPWRAIYAGVDLDVIWKVATTNIPKDKPGIMKILKDEKEFHENEKSKQ